MTSLKQCRVCRKPFDPEMYSHCPYCNKSSSDSRTDNNMPFMQDVYDPDPTPSFDSGTSWSSPSGDSYSGGGGSFGGGGSSGSWDSGSSDSGSSDSGSSCD